MTRTLYEFINTIYPSVAWERILPQHVFEDMTNTPLLVAGAGCELIAQTTLLGPGGINGETVPLPAITVDNDVTYASDIHQSGGKILHPIGEWNEELEAWEETH